jgi:hypothetical protein
MKDWAIAFLWAAGLVALAVWAARAVILILETTYG